MSFIEELAERHALPETAVFHLQLACDELLTNAISYGFPDGGSPKIYISIALKGDTIETEIVDNGIAFNPLAQPEPDINLPLEERKIGGPRRPYYSHRYEPIGLSPFGRAQSSQDGAATSCQFSQQRRQIMAHPILIVDDSGFMRNIIRQILAVDPDLEIAGEAEDGQVALEKEKALKPAVILLDIEMPRLDGLSALKRLKLVSKAKVVILSSVAQLGSPAALEARRLGAFDVIAKPSGAISLDLKAKRGHEILTVVRSALACRRSMSPAMARRDARSGPMTAGPNR